MNRKLSQGRFAALLPAFLFPAFILLLYFSTSIHFSDTDRFYHLALAKLMHEAGTITLSALPQAEDLGWGQYFPDKEFLFHALTRLAYSLAGDGGVVAVGLLAASGLGVALYLFALGFLPPLPAFLCAFSAIATQALVFRLLFLRPFVLALLCFALLVFALARRRPWMAAAAAAAFVLTYHAFYLPLAAVGFAFLLANLEAKGDRAAIRRACGFALAGTLVGLLINPYFPSQIVAGIQHARIPALIQGELKDAGFGLELYPLSAPGFLKFYTFPLFVLLFALRAWPRGYTFRFLFAISAFFTLLAFQTVRAGEYLVPMAGMLFVMVIASLKDQRRAGRLIPAGVAAAQLLTLVYVARTEALAAPDQGLHQQTRAAVAAIPPGPAKVLNCEWDTAPFLLQARPDLRFTDLLDPTFLYFRDKSLHQLRQKLVRGRSPDPHGITRGIFRADYVLCRDPGLNSRLASDPGFQQIYPAEGPGEIRLFRVAEKPNSAFVRAFWASVFPMPGPAEAKRYDPLMRKESGDLVLPEMASATEFARAGEALTCAHLTAMKGEVQRHRGATFLGVGGGEALRVWRNGRLLFASGTGYLAARSVQALVRLEPPLSANDAIDVLACSRAAGSYAGASISFWTTASLYSTCRWKKREATPAQGAVPPLFAGDQETCIGPLAGPVVPDPLRP